MFIALFLIMFTLKLLGFVSFSWWIVVSPLIAQVVLTFGAIAIGVLGHRR